MTQVRSEKTPGNTRLSPNGDVLRVGSGRIMASCLALMVIFPLFCSAPANAVGLDDHSGSRGEGDHEHEHEHEAGEHHGHHSGGPRSSRPGQGFSSRWNEDEPIEDSALNLDHQRVLDGVKSGRYRSLKEVIGIVGIPPSSRIVAMNLRSRGGIDVYSIIVRDESGHIERMTVDAASGERID